MSSYSASFHTHPPHTIAPFYNYSPLSFSFQNLIPHDSLSLFFWKPIAIHSFLMGDCSGQWRCHCAAWRQHQGLTIGLWPVRHSFCWNYRWGWINLDPGNWRNPYGFLAQRSSFAFESLEIVIDLIFGMRFLIFFVFLNRCMLLRDYLIGKVEDLLLLGWLYFVKKLFDRLISLRCICFF